MNKKIVIFIGLGVLAVFLVLVGLVYFVVKKVDLSGARTDFAKEEKTVVDKVSDGTTELKGNLFDLVNQNIPQKCTFSTNIDGVSSTGEVYTYNGKIKSIYSTKVDGVDAEFQSLVDGDLVYTWNNQSEQGMKFNIPENKDFAEDVIETNDNLNKADSFYKEYDYKCSTWLPNVSFFELPRNVEFVDFSQVMVDTREVDTCSFCDFAETEDAINDCKVQMGCQE